MFLLLLMFLFLFLFMFMFMFIEAFFPRRAIDGMAWLAVTIAIKTVQTVEIGARLQTLVTTPDV